MGWASWYHCSTLILCFLAKTVLGGRRWRGKLLGAGCSACERRGRLQVTGWMIIAQTAIGDGTPLQPGIAPTVHLHLLSSLLPRLTNDLLLSIATFCSRPTQPGAKDRQAWYVGPLGSRTLFFFFTLTPSPSLTYLF